MVPEPVGLFRADGDAADLEVCGGCCACRGEVAAVDIARPATSSGDEVNNYWEGKGAVSCPDEDPAVIAVGTDTDVVQRCKNRSRRSRGCLSLESVHG